MDVTRRLEDTEVIPWVRCTCGKVLGNLQTEYQFKLEKYRGMFDSELKKISIENMEDEETFLEKVRNKEKEIRMLNNKLDENHSLFNHIWKILKDVLQEEKLKAKKNDLEEELETFNEQDTLEDLMEKLQKKKEEREQYEKSEKGEKKKIKSIDNKIEDYVERIEKVKKRKEINKSLEETNKKLNELENKKKEIRADLEETEEQLKEIENKKLEMTRIQKEIDETREKITKLRNEIKDLKLNRKFQVEKYEYENALKNLKKNRPDLFQKHIPRDDLSEEENEEREKLRKQMRDLEMQRVSYRSTARRADFIYEMSQKKALEEIGINRPCCISNLMSDIVISFPSDEKLEISIQAGIYNDHGLTFSKGVRRVEAR